MIEPVRPRLFVAVRPPPEVVERLLLLPRDRQPGLRWSEPSTWHVTLRFLGPSDADAVVAALDTVLPGPPATVVLGPVVEQLGRAVVVPARGLDGLATAVRRVTADLGQADDQPFSGHLTLGRLRAGAKPGAALGHSIRAEFVADLVELVASEPGPSGHRHEVLHTWRL